jgi:serine-type D-Ala-D-Ala carboxypeptidase/endopeptidase (penicillin-binding protein 4)
MLHRGYASGMHTFLAAFSSISPRHIAVFALLVALFTPSHGTATSVLPSAVNTRLEAAGIPTEALGAVVMRVRDGKVIWAHNGSVSMQPASTLKVLSSIVALETLQPTYRGRTELRSAAVIGGGVLGGDLVLKGLGDPDFDWQALRAMLVTLKHRGVNDIRGDLLVDRSFFAPPRLDMGVPPFDESPEFRYNVIPDALLLNTNLQELQITSTESAMAITVTPPLDRVRFVSQMTLVDKPCADWENLWQLPTVVKAENGEIEVRLRGEFPKQCPVTTSIAALDRADYADRLFRSLWQSLGGTFTGSVREAAASGETKLIAEHQSRTLAEFNRDINKRSDNPITRLTFLTLGTLPESAAANRTSETTTQRADRMIRQWLREKKIDDAGLVLDNGSGLSRSERITPLALAATLRAAHGSVWAPEFLWTLPIVGVDGGMKNRLANNPSLAQAARFKTGSLRNVTALAGYAPSASGETYAIAVMINHDRSIGRVGRPIIDTLIDWIVTHDFSAASFLPRDGISP